MAKRKTNVLKAHKNLIMDVIRRQAGTLGKAILEGVMNSVDAGATYCNICLDNEVVLIEDDGEGFPSEAMIEESFNTFGHDAPKEYAQKTYGNFRMGRGQMFAFGHNVWESGEFVFDVDVDKRGLEWDLTTGAETGVEGCQITIYLYKALLPSEIMSLERDLKRLVKWVAIPVTLNDVRISGDPAAAEWDYESQNCYVKLKTSGDLSVYNLGVFVRGFSGHTYGRGGEVVSKQQLRLNFARNDVMVSECAIWKEVRKFVQGKSDREIQRRPSLNDSERLRLANQMRASDLRPEERMKVKLFTDVLGRHHSLSQLSRVSCWQYEYYTNALQGDSRGDKVHQQKIAFVFSNQTLDRFEKDTVEDLMKLMSKSLPEHSQPFPWKYRAFSDLASTLSDRYDIIKPEDWSPHEQIVMDVCQYRSRIFTDALTENTGEEIGPRKIVVGLSEAAAGWTDGSTYIALDRNFIKRLELGNISSYTKLADLVLHEYCHTDVDTGAHGHDLEFFQMFHDTQRYNNVSGKFTELALRNLPATMERLGRKLTQRQLKAMDLDHKLTRAASKLPMAASAKN